MTAPPSVLLPGLDGTAKLFAPFIAAAPPAFALHPLALPRDRPRSYAELTDHVLDRAPPEPFALIAESFSGPLALLVADRCPRVTAVVLCASFVAPPLPRILAHVPRFVFARQPPLVLMRHFLTGGDATIALAAREATASVPPRVLADRIASVLSTDVTPELERLDRPLLVLRAQHDWIIPSCATDHILAVKPSATLVAVDGPHLVLQTRATDAWRHIAKFLG